MTEPKTQEEFELLVNKMVEMLNKTNSILDEDVLNSWDECNEIASFFNENGYQPFYTEIRVQPKNNDFSDIYVKIKSEHYMLLYLRNFIHSHTLMLEELSYVCCEYMNLLEKSYKQ